MIPVRIPTAPHPVNPSRPRPLPAPRPNPPRPPRPGRALMSNRTGLTLAFAATSIAAGVAVMVAPLGRTAELWAMPTSYAADLLLVPLIALFVLTSLTLSTRRPMTPDRSAPAHAASWRFPHVGPRAVRAERPVGS